MSVSVEPSHRVELLLFEIGDSVYGADASQVRRIDRPGPNALSLPSLGAPRGTSRALVFATPEGESELLVDVVRGVVNVGLEELRRLPLVSQGHSYTVGVWLGADRPIVLLDLPLTASVVPAGKETTPCP